MKSNTSGKVSVHSELGRLRKIVIHHPDDGVASFPPRKMEDILYDDIVDKQNMRLEYSEYLETLLWFVDPKSIAQHASALQSETVDRLEFFTPGGTNYIKSGKVLDVETMLTSILDSSAVKSMLVSAIGAVERLSLSTQEVLMDLLPSELAYTLITGILRSQDAVDTANQIFAPIPNQIFTRDTTVTIGNKLFITKPKERARYREKIIASFVAKYFLTGGDTENEIIDLEAVSKDGYPSAEDHLTIEGGDMMMIAPGHVMVGLSHRTNLNAIEALIQKTFSKNDLSKISVIKIPSKRDYMHIDTVFTQLKKSLWVIFGPFARMGYEREVKSKITSNISHEQRKPPVDIFQYVREESENGFTVKTRRFDFLEDLLSDISENELGATDKTEFVYSAGGAPLMEEREQWTDSCNFLALKDGVNLGYDRNHMTAKALAEKGFTVVGVKELNKRYREASLAGLDTDQVLKGDTLILLESHELSRARGGAHCMSQPIVRDTL